jgi:hypothetical protein
MRATVERQRRLPSSAVPLVLFGLASVMASVSILWLGRGATFFNDEWNVLAVNAGELTRAAAMFGEFGARTRACQPTPPFIDGGEAVEIAVLTCYVNGLSTPVPAATPH